MFSRRAFLASSAASLAALSTSRWLLADPPPFDAADDDHIFLIGDYEPIVEESTLAELRIEGRLPKELNGFFLRNGPNPQFAPQNNYHVFEGDGMVHGVHLEHGKASYRNRFVRTKAWQRERAAGKAVYPSILDPVDWKQFATSILAGEPSVPNRANTALLWHHGRLLALWEAGPPHELTLPELTTVGEYTFGKKLSHAFTAHPKIDPVTGELIFFGYQPVVPYLQHSVADRNGRITHTTSVPMQRPSMMHDAAITPNYTVFLDTPALLDLTGMLRNEPFFKWVPEGGARIGILPRYAQGDAVRWFEIETCFVFHIFNAYEDGDEVVLHGCRYENYPDVVGFSGTAKVKDVPQQLQDFSCHAHTWRVNLKTGRVSEQPLDDMDSEFPQVRQDLTGRQTQYGYATAFADPLICQFLKYDFATGAREARTIEGSRVLGEAIFVPRENARGEDDGYLLALSYDRVEERSELLVMAADDFAEPPLARVVIPRRVPAGFHAAWVPAT